MPDGSANKKHTNAHCGKMKFVQDWRNADRETMSIPDYQTVMLPLLKLTADGKEHQIQESAMILAGEFKLTENELKEMLPSGGTGIFFSRVGWARTYLK